MLNMCTKCELIWLTPFFRLLPVLPGFLVQRLLKHLLLMEKTCKCKISSLSKVFCNSDNFSARFKSKSQLAELGYFYPIRKCIYAHVTCSRWPVIGI